MANCVQCGRQLPGLSFGKKLCQWCVQHEAAQRGEDSPVQRVEAAPWVMRQSSSMIVTQAIFGINVAVFVAMVMAGVAMFDDPSWQDLVHWGANYGPLTVSGQWWRLLTCVFVHSGLLHIASNMYGLWILGRIAESLYGRWTFAIVYLLCGLSGSIASVVWNPVCLERGCIGSRLRDCGCLGCILLSGRIFAAARRGDGHRSLPSCGSRRQFVFWRRVAGIDNAAHVGGLVMGLILGALIAKVAPRKMMPSPRWRASIRIMLVAGGACGCTVRAATKRPLVRHINC